MLTDKEKLFCAYVESVRALSTCSKRITTLSTQYHVIMYARVYRPHTKKYYVKYCKN